MIEFRYDLIDFMGEFVEVLSGFAEEALKFGEIFSSWDLLADFLLGGVVLL